MSKYRIEQNKMLAYQWNQSIRCLECGDKDFIDDGRTGDTICTGCGCVVAEGNIDMRREWRAFTAQEERSKARTGPPTSILIPDKGLSTVIGHLKSGTPEQFNMAKRLRFSNSRNRGSNIERRAAPEYVPDARSFSSASSFDIKFIWVSSRLRFSSF